MCARYVWSRPSNKRHWTEQFLMIKRSSSVWLDTRHLRQEKPSTSVKLAKTKRNISYPPAPALVEVENRFAGHSVSQGGKGTIFDMLFINFLSCWHILHEYQLIRVIDQSVGRQHWVCLFPVYLHGFMCCSLSLRKHSFSSPWAHFKISVKLMVYTFSWCLREACPN